MNIPAFARDINSLPSETGPVPVYRLVSPDINKTFKDGRESLVTIDDRLTFH